MIYIDNLLVINFVFTLFTLVTIIYNEGTSSSHCLQPDLLALHSLSCLCYSSFYPVVGHIKGQNDCKSCFQSRSVFGSSTAASVAATGNASFIDSSILALYHAFKLTPHAFVTHGSHHLKGHDDCTRNCPTSLQHVDGSICCGFSLEDR